MKKVLIVLALTLNITTFQLSAGIIDRMEAQQLVLEFITQMDLDDFSNPTVDGILTINSSTDSSKPVLYVYNVYGNSGANSRFVIVAGENRARRVLAYGDAALDLSDIPDGLQDLMEIYRQQIESLIVSHPGDEVMLHSTRPGANGNASTVEPMLTTMWGQNAPFNLWCPQYNDSYCSTGCVSTALSMIVHYHAFAQFVEPVPEYTTTKLGIYLEPLEPVDFDWCNMLDVYEEGGYSADEANAVAQLMRYTGQAARMNYTTGPSSALVTDICRALNCFGYDGELLIRGNYETAAWDSLLQEELQAGRPVIYTANLGEPNTGHAFCIDGYDASLNMYHINWGWSGKGNCDCVLDAFSPSTSNSVYNSGQMMVVNIQPAAPRINVDCEALSFNEYTGYTQTQTFTVSGINLTEDVLLSVTDAVNGNAYSVSPSRITPAEAAAGKTVQISFSPNRGGYSSALLTLTSGSGIEPATVTLNGYAIQSQGRIDNFQDVYSFDCQMSSNNMAGLQYYKLLMIPFSWHQFASDPNLPESNTHAVSLNAAGGGTGNTSDPFGHPFQVFSYDLQGDESYHVGVEFVRQAQTSPEYFPNTSAFMGEGGEFAIQILYHFRTLGEHDATLTITHPTLNVKPAVIHLHVSAVWPDDADYLYGDVNGDGSADVSDVAALIAYILGKETGINVQAADVNGDGTVDVTDVAALIKYIIGG